MPHYYDDYKKTDGDHMQEHVVANISWKLWIPIVFVVLALISIIIMLAVVLDFNVAKVSNQDLKNEIRDECGDCGGIYGGGDHTKELEKLFDDRLSKLCAQSLHEYDGSGSSKDCEHEFKEYMNARFQHVYKRKDSCEQGKQDERSEVDWSYYMHSGCSSQYASLKKHFDQRMDYMYELVEKDCGKQQQQLPYTSDMWDVKDLKEYVSDKIEWLGGKIDLIVVENNNDVDNSIDVIIKNENDINVSIKSHLDSATQQLTGLLTDIATVLNQVELYLGMQPEDTARRDSDSRNLRQFIGDGIQDIEDLLSEQEDQIKNIHCTENSDSDDNPTTSAKQWPSSGADTENSKYSEDMTSISRRNVGRLKRRWEYSVDGSVGSAVTATTDGNTVFSTDFAGNVFALSRDTGAVIWKRSVKDILGVSDEDVVIVSRTSPTLYNNCRGQPCVILGAPGDRSAGGYNQWGGAFYAGPVKMFALDRYTGATIWVSPDLDSHPWSQIVSSPTVYGDKVFAGINSLEIVAPLIDENYPCCSFRGSAFALDVHTGAIKWQTYTIPKQQQPNSLHSKTAYAGAGIKGSNPPVDSESRLVFFGSGQFSMFPHRISVCLQNEKENGVYPGESNFKCLEDGLYPDSILALSIDTGAIVYAHRANGVDGWNPSCTVNAADPNCPKPIGYDYDFSQSPILHSVAGERRIFALQKSGVAWSLRAADGAFRWSRYMPTGLLGGGSLGCSHDRAQNGFICQITGAAVVYLSTEQQLTYELADGTKLCDASWWFLDAASGEVKWQTASAYAREGRLCPAAIENPYIRGVRIEGPDGQPPVSAQKTARVGKSCKPRDVHHRSVIENSEFAKSYGSQAVGNGLAYVTEMTGSLYVLDTKTGDCRALLRCNEGSIYGAPSLSRSDSGDELVIVGCGYGRLRKEWIKHSGCENGKCSVTAFGF